MLRELRIGVAADDDGLAGWRRILDQELLPWDRVDGPTHPIILFSGHIPAWCDEFVAEGGIAVISGASRSDELVGPSTTAVMHRFRVPGGDRVCEMPGLARLFAGPGEGECRLHENRKARAGNLADVFPAVVIRRHGAGWVVASGLALAETLAAGGDCLRTFADGSEMTERVASTDKADIADTLVWMLRKAFECRGLPYVRACHYPEGARSVFLFRVDVDGLFGTRCRDLAETATEHGISASFYFNAALCRAFPGELSRDWLDGHEIGHHGDAHDLFETLEENRQNLLGGIAWVEEQLGVRPTSFVAPRGMWNAALGNALRELGHTYSGDFGLDFDSLPFMTPEGILQLPVHPFSAERYAIFREDSGLGAPGVEGVMAHYLAAMRRQVQLGRPVQLYGHPEVLGGMARTGLPDLFRTSRSLGLPNMTLDAFAQWWLRRAETSVTLLEDEDGGPLRVETSGGGQVSLEAWSPAPARIVDMHGRDHSLEASTWTRFGEGASHA